MNKTLLFVLILAFAAPAWSGVILTEIGKTGSTVTIGYNYNMPGSRPRAFGLVLTAEGGTITSVTPTKVGQSTVAAPGFGIFPGTIDLTDPLNPVWNSPVEPTTLPGGPSALGTNRVVVSLASLYVHDMNKPSSAGMLFTVTMSPGTYYLWVTPETTYRGGVVGENGETIAVNPLFVELCADCYCFGQNKSATICADWRTLGSPFCWLQPYQCDGDASTTTEGLSKYRVYQNDLTIVAANWKKTMSDININACADIDHKAEGLPKYRVYQNDLTILVRNWQKKDSQLPGNCRIRPEQ